MTSGGSSQKVLLTGATGFLGSHLLLGLLGAGYEVLSLKRKSSDLGRIKENAKQVQWFDVDDDLETPFKAAGKINHIIHTATNYGRCGESNSLLVETNLLFPLRIYEIATLYNTTTFINTDTILYRYLNGYTLSKKQFCEWFKLLTGHMKVFNIKLEHIYGPKDESSKFVKFVVDQCINNVSELKLTPGEQKRDFIYVTDVVAAYLCLLRNNDQITDTYTDFELGTGDTITIKYLVELIARLTQTKTRLLFGALPYRNNEIMESRANPTKLKQLGWQPKTSLEHGLKEMITEKYQNITNNTINTMQGC
jgi:nucleoside-diphosphate-sugar epimerase